MKLRYWAIPTIQLHEFAVCRTDREGQVYFITWMTSYRDKEGSFLVVSVQKLESLNVHIVKNIPLIQDEGCMHKILVDIDIINVIKQAFPLYFCILKNWMWECSLRR